jgi:hypothetical protein
VTTILVLNAVSSLLAIGGLVARELRRVRREAVMQRLYVSK